MATRLKPSRINVDNAPRVGDGAAYQNDNDFHWSEGGGDMSYEDFEWVTLTGNSLVIEKISNNVTPSSNFTVSAGTVRPGIEYVLRVNTGNTPYTMTLGTGVTNPNGYSTELAPNKVNQFKFIATSDSQLELEGVDTSDFVTLGTQQTITAKKTFDVEPELGTAKTTDATNNGTKLATEAQVYKKIDKVQSPTADHLASLTSGGEVADSGIAKSTVELNTNKETGDAPTDTTSKYPSSHTVKKYVDDQVAAATAGAVSDTAYGSSWDGVTGIAPSKNAVYDKISSIDALIPSEATSSNKLADKNYVDEHDTVVSSTAPSSPTEGMLWYDTTNDQLKVYDGTNWNVTGKEYTAGSGINIDANNEISNTGVLSVNGQTGDVTGLQTTANLKTSLTDNSDSYYPSQKAVKTAVDAKQDALTTQTAYTTKGTATKVPTITTNTLGQVTAITETDITFPVTSVNGQTGAVTVSEFKANNGGVKIFDMPTVNSSMDSIIQWFTGGGDILLREITSNVEYYYFVNNWDGPGRTISVKNITGTTVTVKGIAYDASGICTNIVVNNQYLVPSGGNNGDVLTNVSGTATWSAPSGGDVVVSSQSGNILTSGTKLRAGTEADYGNLSNYDQNTIYLTI